MGRVGVGVTVVAAVVPTAQRNVGERRRGGCNNGGGDGRDAVQAFCNRSRELAQAEEMRENRAEIGHVRAGVSEEHQKGAETGGNMEDSFKKETGKPHFRGKRIKKRGTDFSRQGGGHK